MRKRFFTLTLLGITFTALLLLLLYQLPPIHERLAWRVNSLQTKLFYFLNPPEQVVFIPQERQAQIEAIVQATIQSLDPANQSGLQGNSTPSPQPTVSPKPTQTGPTATPSPSPTPTFTPTPIPEKVELTGILHEYQKMNNCGPATLSMALSYWDWSGDQRDTRAYLRPNFATVDDKNVSPAEMVTYVEEFTDLKALVRVGGDIEILKRLVAAGFPVIIEKGFQPPKEDWMGHYEVVNAYDDTRGRFVTQDSYIMSDFPLPYEQLGDRWWRDFNYLYLVIYPGDQEDHLLSILGPHADVSYNYQYAAQKARQEIDFLTGRDLYFAWYNLGTNLVAVNEFEGAAEAYDQAFVVYSSLPETERPWRMLWYQVGPYEAYYHTGRYQDVISLVNTTLSFLREPILEEAFYWRGMSKIALGDLEGGIFDLKNSVELNPNFTPGWEQLESLGVEA